MNQTNLLNKILDRENSRFNADFYYFLYNLIESIYRGGTVKLELFKFIGCNYALKYLKIGFISADWSLVYCHIVDDVKIDFEHERRNAIEKAELLELDENKGV